MGGSGRVWQVCNFMTQTQPDPLFKKKKNCNPIHQALKIDPTCRVGSGRVGFDGLAGFLHTPSCKRVFCLGMKIVRRILEGIWINEN